MRVTQATLTVAALALACSLFSASAAGAAAAPATWSTPVTVSDAGQGAQEPQVVTDGTTITTVWYRYDGSDNRIQTSSSTNGGETWGTPVTLSDVGGNARAPQVVTNGTTITTMWYRFDGSSYRIQASSSTNRGVTWSTPVNVSEAGGNASDPQIASNGTTSITAAWYRYDGSNNRVQTSSSTNGGVTWSTPVTLSAAGGDAYGSQVVSNGSTSTATWSRNDGSSYQIQTSTSTNGGVIWSSPVSVSDVGQNASDPQVVTDGTTITTMWRRPDGVNDRIQTSSSTNAGVTWSSPVSVSDAGQNASNPQVVTDGTTITTVWSRNDGVNDRIQTSSSTNRGVTWSTPVSVSTAGESASNPQVVTDGTTITTVWTRNDGSNYRLQTSSYTAITPTQASAITPTPELAETGASANYGGAILAGGLLLSGFVAVSLKARHRRAVTRN